MSSIVVAENGKKCALQEGVQSVEENEYIPCNPLDKNAAVFNLVGSSAPSQIIFFPMESRRLR